MRTVRLEEAENHLAELVDEAVAGIEVVIAGDNGKGVRLEPVPVKEQRPVKDKAARRASILALVEKVRAMPDLDPRSPEEILGYDENGLFESADRD